MRENNFQYNVTNYTKYKVDFKKSTTSEYAEKFFMGLLKKYILVDDDINVRGILRDLRGFKDEIRTSIESGETKFLQNGNAKELGAYKNPEREQSIRGVLSWNILNPDNMIELPTRVSLLKLNLIKEEDIEPLRKDYPDLANLIIDKIFNDETGMFVTKKYEDDTIRIVNPKDKTWYEKIPKKYRTKYKKLGPLSWNEYAEENLTDEQGHWEYNKKGLQVLAIPSNVNIPEWCIPYIDYTTTINNITAPFNPVLEIFNLPTIEEGKTGRKSETFSNIIKF